MSRAEDVEHIYVIFGKMARKRRKEMGLTIKEVAEGVGLTMLGYRNIELAHHRVRYHNAYKISRFLGISLDTLNMSTP